MKCEEIHHFIDTYLDGELDFAQQVELQQHLAARGYDVGEPDGRLGGKTRSALRHFQSSVGEVPDGFASAAVLERLRGR